jgi:small basic protein
LAALAAQVLLLWPAGVALVLALGVWATLPVSDAQRVWIAFFVFGTALPAILGLALASDPRRMSPTVLRVVRWFALLISAFVLVIGAVHGVTYRFALVAALVQTLAVASVMMVRREAGPRPGSTINAASAVLWFVVSLAAWGVAGSLIWWIPPDAFLQNSWSVGVLIVSTVLVLGALWLPDAVAGRLVKSVGFGVAVIPLALASVWTNDLFDFITMYHWEFYIGPAELVRQGGWLLWDVPSQYGFLSELAIAWIPTPSPWEGLFILNSAAGFLLAMTVFLLLRSLGRGLLNLLMSVSVALVACFLRPGLGSAFSGPDGYPGTGGFRFIWCVVLLLLLLAVLRASAPRARLTILTAGNLVWIVSVLWSAESAIYSTFVWLPGYFLAVVAECWGQPDKRRRYLTIARLAALPAVFLAAALAIVFVVYQVGLGHGPDLQAFYEYGLTYQAGFGSYPLDPGGPGWVLFVAYVATLVTLAWKVRKQPAVASVVLVAAAALIYATSSYFVGRSHPNNVWNLAPEVCIALAVTLTLAGRDWRTDPIPILLRLASAPILIMLLTGTLGEQAAVVDYVSRPQLPLGRIDAGLPPTDPSLQTLLDAHVRAGDRMVYVCDRDYQVDPLLSPHLYANTEQPNGASVWLPLVPFGAVKILTPTRRVAYLERFIARHPEGGWLIECIGAESEWVRQEIEAHFTPGPSYSNADYRVTLWRLVNGSA